MNAVVATDSDVHIVDIDGGTLRTSRGLVDRPTCVAADPLVRGRVWCGVRRRGVFRSDDSGLTWELTGLDGRLIMSLATAPDIVWAGTEPSEVWRSGDVGTTWQQMQGLDALPSSSEWAFPPRPETHHVRWIALHPSEPERLWVAVEAGALIHSPDGGRTWRDRVPGGPYDTHELAIHPSAPDTLRVAAGDGYLESRDAGATWSRPSEGLEVGYLRSIAIDPGRSDVVVVSAASGPRTSYVAGLSDGRLYRRQDDAAWERVTHGWPDPPATIAPLLASGTTSGRMLAADERGLHISEDAGISWQQVTAWPSVPNHLRGLAITAR
jgi:photosystem II stability/assembly factor-like uncharacterized protein